MDVPQFSHLLKDIWLFRFLDMNKVTINTPVQVWESCFWAEVGAWDPCVVSTDTRERLVSAGGMKDLF